MARRIPYTIVLAAVSLISVAAYGQDAVADNMLLYQRSVGGWPKHVNEVKVDYSRSFSESEKAAIVRDRSRRDATIDNSATVKEIRHLVKAAAATGNKSYLAAAENGIRYLLQMQYDNGGFPQFYPDTNLYRSQITYNDNAMINALNLLWDVANGRNGLQAVDASLRSGAQRAVEKGVSCIVKTQLRLNSKLAGWCAQYNKTTLQPEKARAFELASLSGMESVAIVEFLMKVEQPSAEVKAAVTAAIDWLQSARINGYSYQEVTDTQLPKNKDRVLVPDASAAVWARFYDLTNGRPFFCGRDGIKRWDLKEVDHERRIGYAWYGTWPASLLEKKYPDWKKKYAL